MKYEKIIYAFTLFTLKSKTIIKYQFITSERQNHKLYYLTAEVILFEN